MKEHCGLPKNKSTFGILKVCFIEKLKNDGFDKKDNFNEFKNALDNINPERNFWAHGIVSYESRLENEKANNSIELNQKIKNLDGYFVDINKWFEFIIDWLNKNSLWKIEHPYNISPFKVDIEVKLNKKY